MRKGRVGGSVADAALQEGVRDADAQGAEALAVALEGHLHGWFTAQEIVEDVTPAGGGVDLRICPSWRHDMI